MSNDEIQLVTFSAAETAELTSEPISKEPLADDELTGRTLASLISPGTEIQGAYLEGPFPAKPGYAAVFEVDAAGSGIEDIKVGDLVFCTGPHGIGGHRSRQRCTRKAAIPVPRGLAPEVAVHARLMGVSMTTLTTTVARPPDRVMVAGLGPIGHLGAQLFRAAGYRVIGVEPSEARREMAQARGISPVLPFVPTEDKASLEELALVLECSGHERAVLDACRSVRKRGEVVLVGVPRKRRTDLYAFDVLEAVFRGYVTLRSGWEWEISRTGEAFRVGSVFGNLAGALDWLADGRVNVEGLYEKVSPGDAQHVYQNLLHQRGSVLSAVFDWS